MNETTGKLEILTLLNHEFFSEVREKKDEATLTNHFGGPLGRLLWRHALLEERYSTVQADQEMMHTGEEEGNEPISEELRIA